MKILCSLLLLGFTANLVYAQPDSTQTANPTVEVYDVVAIYKQITDGRGRTQNIVSEVKGEILNYDESTGVLTFKDREGRIYSLKSGDYKYFEYDKEFVQKVKNKSIKERKTEGFEYSAGFRASYVSLNNNLSSDGYYLNSSGGVSDLPIAIFLGVGKYFGREHYFGVNGEIALTSYGRGYFSAGLRYCMQYDAMKRNVAFYLPVELNYFRAGYDETFQVDDTLVTNYPGGGVGLTYPKNVLIKYDISAFSLSLGQGFGFMMDKKRSLALEVALIRYFPFAPKFRDLTEPAPDLRFTGNGFRLSLIYNI